MTGSPSGRHRPNDQPVIAWPRITATITDPSDGSLVINGTSYPCWAETTAILRIGMIARCAAVAITLGRPVRVDVTEGAQCWSLAVGPDGVVQEIDKQGRFVDADEGLTPINGPCRRCGESNPVTYSHCRACGVDEPLGVLAAEPRFTALPGRTDNLDRVM